MVPLSGFRPDHLLKLGIKKPMKHFLKTILIFLLAAALGDCSKSLLKIGMAPKPYRSVNPYFISRSTCPH